MQITGNFNCLLRKVLATHNKQNQTEDYQMAIFTWNCMATDGAREVYIAGGDEMTVLELPYRSFSAVKLTGWDQA